MVEIFSYEEIYDAYIDCCNHKKNTVNCCDFMIDHATELYVLWEELNNGTYTVGKSTAFVVHTPKDREIFAADFRDRIIHHLISQRIMPYLEQEFIVDSYSCMGGRGTTMAVYRCARAINIVSNGGTSEAYILKGDFKNFFMLIDKRLMYDRICQLLDKYENWDDEAEKRWKHLIAQVVFNCPQENCKIVGRLQEFQTLPRGKSLFECDEWHGIPIGNLTSQLFANLYLSDFDWFVKEALDFEYYGRYVDDFYIVCNSKEKLLRVIPKIKKYLSKIGVVLHPRKVSITNAVQGVEFLGAFIKPRRILVGTRTKANFWKTVRKHDVWLSEHKFPNESQLSKIQSSINSYIGFFMQYNSYNLRKAWLISERFGNLTTYFVVDDNLKKITKFLRQNICSFETNFLC